MGLFKKKEKKAASTRLKANVPDRFSFINDPQWQEKTINEAKWIVALHEMNRLPEFENAINNLESNNDLYTQYILGPLYSAVWNANTEMSNSLVDSIINKLPTISESDEANFVIGNLLDAGAAKAHKEIFVKSDEAFNSINPELANNQLSALKASDKDLQDMTEIARVLIRDDLLSDKTQLSEALKRNINGSVSYEQFLEMRENFLKLLFSELPFFFPNLTAAAVNLDGTTISDNIAKVSNFTDIREALWRGMDQGIEEVKTIWNSIN